MRVAVVTVAAHRDAHLRNHLLALARSERTPDDHVVVAIGDPGTVDVVGTTPRARPILLPHDNGPLPLAAARNTGAEAAVDAGADLLIFLDVDCLADPTLLDRYLAAARTHPTSLLCGPVTYLPAAGPSGYDLRDLRRLRHPHPARPDPPAGTVRAGTDYDLFWSLSFALTATTWSRIGGFCTDYTGYGGEDTDFAQTAAKRGIGLRWVGGADAYHQHHPVSDPPVEHLRDIIANATVFHRRWGRWPMIGWLEAFAAQGLITYDETQQRWV
ncbi:galactosyltransferase-related protein [Rhodococcus sp. T2V]|uniref:glycosyltransferase family 2 protein n=1 Tax=Rhodococcus sp. T2V TaxID=3034164 RepID=UPI0023E23569|nr:galactosyltransferase-related protein [Rhodococcus sp. T2V]MDF3312028.1 galactosyltransferase-related protein [Rhodococcus sp. T2V]